MSGRPGGQDLVFILKGLKKVGSAAAEIKYNQLHQTWQNSTIRPLSQQGLTSMQEGLSNLSKMDLSKNATEAYDRLSVVVAGIQTYTKNRSAVSFEASEIPTSNETTDLYSALENPLSSQQLPSEDPMGSQVGQSLLQANESIRKTTQAFEAIKWDKDVPRTISDDDLAAISDKLGHIGMSSLSEEVQGMADVETASVVGGGDITQFQHTESLADINAVIQKTETSVKQPTLIGRKPLSQSKPQSMLSKEAQARKVPHSQFGRLMAFGGLAAGLGVGAVAEATRQTLGMGGSKSSGSLTDSSKFLTEANAERIVATLCKVRGAALKLGQMISIQDDSMINPQLQKIMERVRQSADFMPKWQLERTLVKSLGSDWREQVSSFDDKPFAAASIGQVHQAILHDGRSVAMKIQYPGVAEGIDSDINNLMSTLKYANIFPAGLYVDSAIAVAKRELAWECDYERELECTKRYGQMLAPYPDYYVPEVIDQLCTKQIFTTELIDGIPVDKCVDLDQVTRNRICELILELCLREIFQFGFMQTDPNWSNYFYNAQTQQILCLDFGACREYKKEFVDDYIEVIHGAATNDRQKIYEYSKSLKFLSGYEAKIMEEAHIDTVMILGEAFRADGPFHFGAHHTTHRVHNLIPVMLNHRMVAPPEESYSLHRKLAGVFLLCAKLRGVVQCRPFFDNMYANYQKGGTWADVDQTPIR